MATNVNTKAGPGGIRLAAEVIYAERRKSRYGTDLVVASAEPTMLGEEKDGEPVMDEYGMQVMHPSWDYVDLVSRVVDDAIGRGEGAKATIIVLDGIWGEEEAMRRVLGDILSARATRR